MGRRAPGTGIRVPALGTGLCVLSHSPGPWGHQVPAGRTLAWLRRGEAPGLWGSCAAQTAAAPRGLTQTLPGQVWCAVRTVTVTPA